MRYFKIRQPSELPKSSHHSQIWSMQKRNMNTFLSSLLFPLLLLGSSHAFMAFHPTIKQHSIQSVPKLNDIDLMAIENVAELCLQAEGALVNDCDLEEHEALVNQLQAQRNLLVDQVTYLEDLLERLQGK